MSDDELIEGLRNGAIPMQVAHDPDTATALEDVLAERPDVAALVGEIDAPLKTFSIHSAHLEGSLGEFLRFIA